MINLIPLEEKKEIHAARANVIILRYIFLLFGGIGFLIVVLIGSYVNLHMLRQAAQVRVDANQNKTSQYSKTELEANLFRSNLATAKEIIDKEVNYSKLMIQIAATIPQNVVLDNLSLDSKTLGSEATITASAKSYTDSLILKQHFQNNPSLFTSVHFQSLTTQDTTGAPDPYPVKITMSVVISKGNS